MKNQINAIITTAFLLLITACSGNEVYVDVEKEQLISCTTSAITYFLITDQDQNTWIAEARSKASAQSAVDLKSISTYYLVQDPLGVPTLFELQPNAQYTLLHSSNGDVAGYELQFITDSQAKIKSCSAQSCQ